MDKVLDALFDDNLGLSDGSDSEEGEDITAGNFAGSS